MVNKTKFMQQRFEKMQMSHAKCGLFLGSSLNSSKRKKENKKKAPVVHIVCVCIVQCDLRWTFGAWAGWTRQHLVKEAKYQKVFLYHLWKTQQDCLSATVFQRTVLEFTKPFKDIIWHLKMPNLPMPLTILCTTHSSRQFHSYSVHKNATS